MLNGTLTLTAPLWVWLTIAFLEACGAIAIILLFTKQIRQQDTEKKEESRARVFLEEKK